MSVMTVNGRISPENLGIVNTHEHLFIQWQDAWIFDHSRHLYKRDVLDKPVTMDILGILHRDPTVCKDNLRYSDSNLAYDEANEFKIAGGHTIVDCTPKYLGRNPIGLRNVARRTGLNIIAGTGFYVESAIPKAAAKKTSEELAAIMIGEITGGMDGSDIRPGIIGEIGTSVRTTPTELKVLHASAKAHVETRAPIYVHTERPGREGMTILDTLEKYDVNLNKVVMCHCSDGIGIPRGMDVGYQEAIADRGAYLGYDNFGQEEYNEEGGNMIDREVVGPRDYEKVDAILELVRDGYIDHILVSNDVCYKIHLKTYGGYGLAHTLRDIAPSLVRRGFSKRKLNTILVKNPRSLFS